MLYVTVMNQTAEGNVITYAEEFFKESPIKYKIRNRNMSNKGVASQK